MIGNEEVKKLASLARIDIKEEDLPRFVAEFDGILAYVGQLEMLTASGEATVPALRNVMREDGTPHESGAFTEKLVAQFPARKGDALSVKQIISHD
ncbi:MAG: aspartyl/glutamyl-tRNA amidotransferase subunit C [Candidatus Pacebacteria bacterium]|nr:aspartyl/glutamyl-tRNA amidotransferase subunit C [Candidatus Paceibacterota bacterium]MBP9840225.1 aspartyl/glutamyl-tRNA amidotransferase subunit C [Candidatus Paceibacterota bacterium]